MSLFNILVRISVDDIVYKFSLDYRDTLGGDNPQSAQSAAEAFRVQCATPIRNILSDQARLESIYCRKVDGPTIPAWRGNLNNHTGTIVSDAMSAQNCMLINLRNSAGLLKRSGRIFVSGIPESGITDGVLNAGYISPAVDAFMASIIAIPAGGNPPWAGQLVVVRNQIDGVPQVPPVMVDVDGVDVTLELGTQHHRKGELTGFRT